MPSSYQGPQKSDKDAGRTYSQTPDTNLSTEKADVAALLKGKDGHVFSIGPDDTLGVAVERLRDHRIGALLVTETGPEGAEKLVGILSERDIVRKLADTPGRTLPQKVAEVMTENVETCAPEEKLVSVLKRMTAGRFRHMPVLEAGRLVGMVTIGDVVHYRLTELEHEALQLKQLIVG